MSADPYAYVHTLDEIRFELRLGFAVRDPRALAKPMPIAWQMERDLALVIDDPAMRWARSWGEFWRQLRDIFRHEWWMARGKPARSPGARWVAVQEVVDA